MTALVRIGNLYARALGRPGLAKLHKAMFYLSGRALGLLNHETAALSGEHAALAWPLAGVEAPVVFDVGANDGEWTRAVLERYPDARIHAFEPQQRLAAQIAELFPNVHVNAVALGNATGTLELHDYADHPGSQHASLLEGVIDGLHKGRKRSTSVEVDTFDSYCTRHGIDVVDLLKIDVEGFEQRVLQGASAALMARRVRHIQFEFNEMNVLSRSFMSDFMTLLGADYRFYRLLPHGLLELKTGAHWFNEQFAFQNILALPAR